MTSIIHFLLIGGREISSSPASVVPWQAQFPKHKIGNLNLVSALRTNGRSYDLVKYLDILVGDT